MQTLALRYRPKNFNELIGQDVVAKSISHALDTGRLGHAYLFSGLRGSGKTSSARIFARAMLCERGVSSHPCMECDNCVSSLEGRNIDIIEMDAASHRKIDDIRELIEQTKYHPSSARFKIFIIDEVHMLTKEAFNALLKTLEEPPSYIKFILATTDPLKLPATILSRTQHFRFKPISKDEIRKHLEFVLNKEGIEFENGAIEILARSGSGSLRDTLTMLDQAIIFSKEKITQSSVASMLGLVDPMRINEILELVENQDKIGIINAVKELSNFDAISIIDGIIANLKDKFLNPNPSFSILIYERFFRILSQSKHMLSLGSDCEFALSVMFFMMMEAYNIDEIDEKIESIKPNFQPNTHLQATQTKTTQNIDIKEYQDNQSVKNSPFDLFVNKIYDRSYELGRSFSLCVDFVSFENQIMVLESSASGEQKDILNKNWSILQQIFAELFGRECKISIKKKSEFDIKAIENLIKVDDVNIDKKDTSKEADEILNQHKLLVQKSQEESNFTKIRKNKEYLENLFGKPEIGSFN